MAGGSLQQHDAALLLSELGLHKKKTAPCGCEIFQIDETEIMVGHAIGTYTGKGLDLYMPNTGSGFSPSFSKSPLYETVTVGTPCTCGADGGLHDAFCPANAVYNVVSYDPTLCDCGTEDPNMHQHHCKVWYTK